MVFLSLLLLQLSLTQVQSNKCYAASMEGGGPLGAYEAGCLLALTEFVPISQLAYQIIGGISIGSYNTCWCSGFEVGDERNMALNLKKIWLSVTSAKMLFKPWPGVFFLFFRPSAVNNAAALELIINNMGSDIKRNVTVGTTNVNTGKLENFNETLGPEYLPHACFASGAYPGALPPVNFFGEYYIDGCATANLNPFSVIHRCRELGYADSDIVVDLYYDVYLNIPPKVRMNTTKQAVDRINTIDTFYRQQWFISQAHKNFPQVTYRYEMAPTQNIKIGLKSFTTKNFQFEIDLGYNDTVKLIKKTQQERTEDFKKMMTRSRHFK